MGFQYNHTIYFASDAGDVLTQPQLEILIPLGHRLVARRLLRTLFHTSHLHSTELL